MLAASGCHKDSFDFDEFNRPTATPDTETPDGPTTSDPTTNSLELTDTTFEQFDRVARDAGYVIVQTDAMRAGQVPADFGDITSRQYNSPDGNTRVLVEILDYAHLGIQINGNIDDADFVFAHFIENVVTPPTTSSTIAGAAADTMVRAIAFNGINPPILPTATYALEGEMTYNGNRFYPDGELMADFANARIGGEISLDGSEAEDDFGGTTFADGTTPITNSDNLTLGFGDVSDADNSGDILNDDLGFSGALNIITAEGFFSSLSGRPTGTYSGRFNDDTDSYVGGNAARAAPQEISGIFGGITDADNNGNELKGGFLGQCSADCRLPIRLPIIRVMSSTGTAQERNGQIVLMITSDADAPEGGLAVDINIGGALNGEFTANMEADCTNLVCTVTILEDNRQVDLVLTPTSDFSTEGSEDWTATLVDLGSYDVDATSRGVDFTITDLIAAVGIMTSDTPMEGGAGVTLTITSSETVPATLIGGLNVTIDISGANAADIQPNADCTAFPRCIVNIPAGSDSADLVLSLLSDFSTETESWTASLRDGSDFNLAANFNVDFAITDLIAAIGIMTDDAVMEGNAVVLTITSSIAAPANGLTVTINIGVADATEFTSGDCTGSQCVITITSGMMAELTITALSGDEAENVEMWTATIEPDTAIFNVDAANDDDTFNITNLPLPAFISPLSPAFTNPETLANLNAYDLPITLAANAIRAGEDTLIAADVITGFQYNDADGNPQVYVQLLTHAHLGIWTDGQVPTVITSPTGMVDNDFRYAFLGDNAVNPPADTDGRGDAIYNVEGDATYKGVNFFPGGQLTMRFDAGTFEGRIAAVGGVAESNLNVFGDANAMVPDVNDLDGDGDITELREVGFSDALQLDISNGMITGDGFESALTTAAAIGFFRDLATFTSASFSGRFYDESTYAPRITAPDEVAGTGVIVDGSGMNDLHFGFLGQCFTGCNSLPIIGISSSADTIQEGGQVALMITSDTVASAGGFLVTIDISGAMDGEFTTTPASVCDSNLVCRVTILENERSVNLILSPTDDSDNTENTENWMATLRDGSNYNRDAANNNVAFDIVDPLTLPTAMNGRTLAELNAYDIPSALAADAIRNFQSDAIDGVAITASLYADASGMPQVYVQLLEFAALGIWINGNTPEIGVFDHLNYDYAFLGDNVVTPPAMSDLRGIASYTIEGDATYKGVNFFPDGSLNSDFDAGTFSLVITADGGEALDDFGSATAMLPDGSGMRSVVGIDSLVVVTAGTIDSSGFQGTPMVNVASGFFVDLFAGATGTVRGGFYDDPLNYDSAMATPRELSGVMEIVDAQGNLEMGFLGRRP